MAEQITQTEIEHEPPQSVARIGAHPIHPMIIPFPIAFLVGALFTDIIYMLGRDSFWAQVSYVLLLAGLATGVAAAVFGGLDFWSNRLIRAIRGAWLHMGGNIVVLLLALMNVLTRANENPGVVTSPALLLSVLTVVLMVGTGWLGGELVYRHRVGIDAGADA